MEGILMAIESPAYTVEKREGDIEIRIYDDYIVAQVDVEADYDSALNKGFRILANYIFGANHKKSNIKMTVPVTGENLSDSEKIPMTVPVTEEETSEKISMTAPVTSEEKQERHVYRISFTMPSKYTMETLPVPDDDKIKLKEMKNIRTAVIKFSGRAKEKLAQKEIKILKSWLEEQTLNQNLILL
jgi:CRISPR/Cas system CMR-associated protein Cmr1 (group 7 of RAMP superfamily)